MSLAVVIAALCMTLLVSYPAVLAEAAGAARQYGSLMGKADRMAWLGLAALSGAPLALEILPYVLLIGGGLTLLE